MNVKILAIAIVFLMICSTLAASANRKINDNIKNNTPTLENYIHIRIARYSAFGLIQDTFDEILDGYQWKVGNTTYSIETVVLTDTDIYGGALTTENYDLLIIPAADFIVKISYRLFYPSISNSIWKTSITNFVQSGGGFIGYCSPTEITAKLKDKPSTLPEIVINFLDLKISGVQIIYNINLPFFAGLSNKPESIGQAAYLYYSGMGVIEKGIPLDVPINKSNPIFDDCIEDSRRICWCGGPAFEVTDQNNHNIGVIASYPAEEISSNESTQIHAWIYTGGIQDFIYAFFKLINNNFTFRESLEYSIFLASDWEMTDEVIQTTYANKPFMTIEQYPNDHQARIILCGGHPEYRVWWGGYIEDVPDTKENCLVDGLYQWKDKTPTNATKEDEETYNWWIVRRHAAWASKQVLDNDLPPIYGVSQVSDIYPYIQVTNFTIMGNSEISDGIESLSLCYRYSTDNTTWTPWTTYDTDLDGSNGWSWAFNPPQGTGFYQFYSLRSVYYERGWVNETAPPGPDALAFVQME